MLNKELLEILACPKCKGELEYQTEPHQFICQECKLKYLVKDDIPNFLIDEAESISVVRKWTRSYSHLSIEFSLRGAQGCRCK